MSSFYEDPNDEMLEDVIWNAIWLAIKEWDINVPDEYNGYMGATGNHVTAIYKNVINELYKGSIPAKINLTQEGDQCPLCNQNVHKLGGILACACIDVDEDGNLF